jgi:superfamily II DNA or RNA helicase
MLRLHLPPNLTAAAARDAVPIRVELNLDAAPPAAALPVLALLQRWCGPKPPAFLQLTRAQLRDLAAAAGGEPFFVENGRATTWQHDELVAPPPSAQSSAAPVVTPARPRVPAGATPLIIDGSEHFLAITLPSREHPAYDEALTLVRENGFILEPSNRKWWLRDRHKTLQFLSVHRARLRDHFGAQTTPNFEKNAAHFREAELVAEVGEAGDEFAVTLGLRAGGADESALRSAIASNRGYVEAGGSIYLLDARKLEKLAAAQRALAADNTTAVSPCRMQRVSTVRAAEAQEILEEISPNFQAPDAWRTRSAALRNLSTLAPAPLPAALDTQLRAYQRLGAAWLWHLFRHELGGVLADEMGLGKTAQALALLSSVATAANSRGGSVDAKGCSLVVAPASLLENWRREAARFAPHLRVFVHHADHRLAAPADFAGFDLVITSYGTLTRDQVLFTSTKIVCAIADEAQHIKNRRSQNAAALRALQARARFVLTGTPLENSLDDLRSLFDFVLPGYVPRVPAGVRGDERAWFDQRLRAQTAPYILRRTKRTVAPELPEKLEQVVWCELLPAQARLYRETQESSERELFDLETAGASEAKLKFAALTQLLRLRQICCDPRLVTNRANGSLPPDEATTSDETGMLPNGDAFAGSAKLDALRELLAEAIDDGHRVLIFSQFTSLLSLVRAELDAQQITHCYLDGSMTARARQAEVDRFQSGDGPPVFLLSLKAGGTGLNLTAADTVVHFDPWWNPAVEAQATDRAHRIGQKRVVTSYKLIASGTVEEKVLALQAEKRALVADVFEASDALAAKLSLTDLKSLLK